MGTERTYRCDAHKRSGTTAAVFATCHHRASVCLFVCQERLKTKCEVYWPREVGCSVVYGSIEVTLTDFTQLADYTIRSLTINKVTVGEHSVGNVFLEPKVLFL